MRPRQPVSKTPLQPHILIQFVVTHRPSGDVLLARHSGTPVDQPNHYLLPSGLLKYGRSVEGAVADLIAKRFSLPLKASYIGTTESLVHLKNGGTIHSLLLVYTASTRIRDCCNLDDQYTYEWHKPTNLGNLSPLLAELYALSLQNTPQPFQSSTLFA